MERGHIFFISSDGASAKQAADNQEKILHNVNNETTY